MAAVLVTAVAFATGILVASGLAEEVGWKMMRSDLEEATASQTYPSHAGLAQVVECTTIDGKPAFEFGPGDGDQVIFTQADALPAGFEFEKELSGGWRVVLCHG